MDKFYTKPIISAKCISTVEKVYGWKDWDLVVEPSSGNGSFLLQIPFFEKIGIDIEPEHKDVIKQDFFMFFPPQEKKSILVIGNPPFGRVSSMAIKFFNHASKWAKVIAFIVPKTFRRISVQNKLDPHFKLIYDEDIPQKPCSFIPEMMVKCCFQIWERQEFLREKIILPTTHEHWIFLKMGPKDSNQQPTPPLGADFAIRAYGGKCGEIRENNLFDLRPKSWHWIKSNIEVEELKKRFKSLNYSICLDTARQNSIGKGELVKLYRNSFG